MTTTIVRFDYETASIVASVDEPVTVTRGAGLVTVAIHAAMMRDLARMVRGEGITRLVNDARGFVFMLSPQAIANNIAHGPMNALMPRFAAANVVQAHDIPAWEEYGRLMAYRGVLRAAFTELEPAVRWVMHQPVTTLGDLDPI